MLMEDARRGTPATTVILYDSSSAFSDHMSQSELGSMSADCGAAATPRGAAHRQDKWIVVWRAGASRWSPELWREATEFGSEDKHLHV